MGDLSTAEEKTWVFDVTLALRDAEIEIRELEGIVVRWQYTDLVIGELVTGEKRIKLELVDKENWVEPARDEDIVAELKALRLEDVRRAAQDLYDRGDYAQADAMFADVTPDSTQVFFLSGNGSQVADANGDEADREPQSRRAPGTGCPSDSCCRHRRRKQRQHWHGQHLWQTAHRRPVHEDASAESRRAAEAQRVPGRSASAAAARHAAHGHATCGGP
jgi:hypothetical protein